MSEHAYSAVAEYASFDWIRKEMPTRLDGDWAHYLEGFPCRPDFCPYRILIIWASGLVGWRMLLGTLA